MLNDTQRIKTPSHEAVLEGLRRACYRQVVRYRHDLLFDDLKRMKFVAWVRQPLRISQQPSSIKALRLPAPIEVAELTDAGRAALDRLVSYEHTGQWPIIRATPYISQSEFDSLQEQSSDI